MLKFNWDMGNIKHIIDDYPERKNTINEVESIFEDPNFIIENDIFIDNEQRFFGIGKSESGIIKVVVFVIRNDTIRPISSWIAKQKFKNYYNENVREK